jgi:hypothetical protein
MPAVQARVEPSLLGENLEVIVGQQLGDRYRKAAAVPAAR